jgi:hypothetical protein
MPKDRWRWRDHLTPRERAELIRLEVGLAELDRDRRQLAAKRYRIQNRAAGRAREVEAKAARKAAQEARKRRQLRLDFEAATSPSHSLHRGNQ